MSVMIRAVHKRPGSFQSQPGSLSSTEKKGILQIRISAFHTFWCKKISDPSKFIANLHIQGKRESIFRGNLGLIEPHYWVKIKHLLILQSIRPAIILLFWITVFSFKSRVQFFSMQAVINKCFLLPWKKLEQIRLVVFEKNAKTAL